MIFGKYASFLAFCGAILGGLIPWTRGSAPPPTGLVTALWDEWTPLRIDVMEDADRSGEPRNVHHLCRKLGATQ